MVGSRGTVNATPRVSELKNLLHAILIARTETFFHNRCSQEWTRSASGWSAVANSLSLSKYNNAKETAAGTKLIQLGNMKIARGTVWGAGSIRVIVRFGLRAFHLGKKMTRILRMSVGTAWLTASLMLPVVTDAQQAPPSTRSGYSLARETNLVGTVSSVVEDSKTGPLGTNVMLQTSSGVVDVHVGSANYLKLNHLELATGDNVRVIGELFSTGSDTVFLARIVQKRTTAVAVRSPKGMPLWRTGTRLQAATKTQSQRGAL
jgi:hypothetical protein